MTCIVGVVDTKNKRVLIGADSAGISGWDITIRKDKKVFNVGDFVIGCTSSFRMIQLLQFSFNPPDIGGKDIFEYMCTDFINAVRTCFRDGGYLQKYTDGDEKGGSFLVGYGDRLFKVDEDFQVGESAQGFDSCGAGAFYALGAIFNTKETSSAADAVMEALAAAEYFSSAVSDPFSICATNPLAKI